MLNYDDDVLVDQDAIDASVTTMSVSEFVRHVNGILKRGLAGGVWVQGEIESFNDRNKHTYFNLVERDGKTNATVNVALWDGIRNRLRPMLERHRLELGNGIKVRVHGVADVWDVNGKFSFKVDNIDPLFTLGDLAGQRDEVIKKLRDSGCTTRTSALKCRSSRFESRSSPRLAAPLTTMRKKNSPSPA